MEKNLSLRQPRLHKFLNLHLKTKKKHIYLKIKRSEATFWCNIYSKTSANTNGKAWNKCQIATMQQLSSWELAQEALSHGRILLKADKSIPLINSPTLTCTCIAETQRKVRFKAVSREIQLLIGRINLYKISWFMKCGVSALRWIMIVIKVSYGIRNKCNERVLNQRFNCKPLL